jgi:phosphoenolpyruvate-protein phosphotransferase (PTS system enzyme I)
MIAESEEIWLTGKPICRGIAIGIPYFFQQLQGTVPEFTIEDEEEIEEEIERYYRAIAEGKEDIKILQSHLQKERIYDGAAILDAHLEMMQDPLLTTYVEDQIRHTRKNAEYVFDYTINECQKKFNSIADPFFRERFKDIRDISTRILDHLRNSVRVRLADIPSGSIIFSTDLSAFDTAEAKSDSVGAFVTREGGTTSHVAILARAKGIPYISSIHFEKVLAFSERLIIVDGRTGHIILNPTEKTLAKYTLLRDQLQIHLQKINSAGHLEAETFDGYRIQLSANIEMFAELDMLHQYGGNGVGLLRTESTFLSKGFFPDEQEQFEIYLQFVKNMKGLPIVIRTFDVGGDKFLRKHQTERESNPFLGCRAIRFLLREREIFKTQLRAILRASSWGNISIMFPMISSLSELLEAKQIFYEVKEELKSLHIPFASHIPIGCMIEVPSAAIIADLLAKESDFLSIGTNDLVQYSLAVDRTNNSISSLYTPTHPSVIRLIKLVASEANRRGIPVSVCGEVAADPRFTPLLLGLGVHELSVASRYLPIIKNAIRNISIVAANKLAEKALKLCSATEIEDLITKEYKKNVPEDCFYN